MLSLRLQNFELISRQKESPSGAEFSLATIFHLLTAYLMFTRCKSIVNESDLLLTFEYVYLYL